MKRLFFAILLVCFSSTLNAQVNEGLAIFIKADDPNTLEYFYVHDDTCPWSAEAAENVIEGVIKRSRINTREGLGGPNNFHLNVGVTCIENEGLGHAANLRIHYADLPVFHFWAYGSLIMFGADSKQYALDRLKNYIELAVTDFVEVNFLSESN